MRLLTSTWGIEPEAFSAVGGLTFVLYRFALTESAKRENANVRLPTVLLSWLRHLTKIRQGLQLTLLQPVLHFLRLRRVGVQGGPRIATARIADKLGSGCGLTIAKELR